MKKLMFILFLIFVSCKKQKKFVKNLSGYFYNKNKFEFYQFKNDSIFIYNFNDSILSKKRIEVYDKYIKIGYKKYNYVNFDDDSLHLKSRSISLAMNRFSYDNFKQNKLKNKYWYPIQKKSDNKLLDSISIIVEKAEIITFLESEKSKIRQPVGYNFSLGVFFNKFPLYSSIDGVRSIVNVSNDTLIMILGNKNYSKKLLFKKQ